VPYLFIPVSPINSVLSEIMLMSSQYVF
jgi:hypothetical protein